MSSGRLGPKIISYFEPEKSTGNDIKMQLLSQKRARAWKNSRPRLSRASGLFTSGQSWAWANGLGPKPVPALQQSNMTHERLPDELEDLEVDGMLRCEDVQVGQDAEVGPRRPDVDGERRQRREDHPGLGRRRTVFEVMVAVGGNRNEAAKLTGLKS